ncbi:TPA: NERD domain-containing protein [Klebsiella pneumoniae]|nr:nuclease-related domain protein [Klebsiella pneumoniae]EKT4000591.1 NERD domain-containing protein [Klebsiella pneumoniae]PYZ04206.1 NERD domain-containing protein [Klebsiella pneumoniae]HBV0956346.1 NERD domain-containing protein [Klebsiella pneumoniae]HCF8861826.1 NERD domain-containing protein [Klebsiella pneumoniae]
MPGVIFFCISDTLVPTTYLVDTTLSDASDYDQTVHAVRLLFISTKGIFIIEEKNYTGDIYGALDDKTWTVVYGFGKAKHKMLNPFVQNKTHISGVCRAIKRGDDGIVNVVLLTGSSKFMVDPVPEWLCRNCDDLGNKFTAYDAEPVFSVEETGWIENDLRKAMLPQTLLTDLGHVYSLKLKHRQPISVPHRVTYFTLLTTTLFFRALKKLFSRKRSEVIHKQYRE